MGPAILWRGRDRPVSRDLCANRGSVKGTTVTAACLMYVHVKKDTLQKLRMDKANLRKKTCHIIKSPGLPEPLLRKTRQALT